MRFIDEDGSEYEGEWDEKNACRDGRGVQFYPNGTIYEGHWKSGKRDGKGRLMFSSGNFYSGEFKNNLEDGHGV